MTANRETSEDLTQEIFIRVFQKLHQFNFQASFATWFYRLALNHCLNYRQRGPRPQQALDELPAEPSLNHVIEDEIFREQLQSHIHKALLTLKPKLRLILILKDIEGLSYAEVAARLELSEGTVASRLNRARKVLALKLTHLRGTV